MIYKTLQSRASLFWHLLGHFGVSLDDALGHTDIHTAVTVPLFGVGCLLAVYSKYLISYPRNESWKWAVEATEKSRRGCQKLQILPALPGDSSYVLL